MRVFISIAFVQYMILFSTIEAESCGCAGLSRDKYNLKAISEEINTDIDTCTPNESVNQQSSVEKMIFVDEGSFYMGTDNPKIQYDGESPRRRVHISAFLLDTFEVTNKDFQVFVNATNYTTESELFGWSFVFHSAVAPQIKDKITQAVLGAEWWLPVNNSWWLEPEGPGTNVFETNRELHPVSQVSWNDAVAYCSWRRARLPTEAEWEYAARGGRNGTQGLIFPWGNSFITNGTYRANTYQGNFPSTNKMDDGYEFLAPVGSYPPQNELGFHDLIGNIWEWTSDWWTIEHLNDNINKKISMNVDTILHDPKGPKTGSEKTKKGGSFLCHKSYCYRYRNAARHHATPDSGTSNGGFRCAKDIDTTK